MTEADGVVIIPMAEWEAMYDLLKKTHAKVSMLQSSGVMEGPTVLRRETTIITKKTIEERIANENDVNAGNWFVVNMELKAKLGKQLKKVDKEIDEELKIKEKKSKKKKVKKKRMVEINAR